MKTAELLTPVGEWIIEYGQAHDVSEPQILSVASILFRNKIRCWEHVVSNAYSLQFAETPEFQNIPMLVRKSLLEAVSHLTLDDFPLACSCLVKKPFNPNKTRTLIMDNMDKLWPSKTVKYVLHPNLTEHEDKISDAIGEWVEASNNTITFTKVEAVLSAGAENLGLPDDVLLLRQSLYEGEFTALGSCSFGFDKQERACMLKPETTTNEVLTATVAGLFRLNFAAIESRRTDTERGMWYYNKIMVHEFGHGLCLGHPHHHPFQHLVWDQMTYGSYNTSHAKYATAVAAGYLERIDLGSIMNYSERTGSLKLKDNIKNYFAKNVSWITSSDTFDKQVSKNIWIPSVRDGKLLQHLYNGTALTSSTVNTKPKKAISGATADRFGDDLLVELEKIPDTDPPRYKLAAKHADNDLITADSFMGTYFPSDKATWPKDALVSMNEYATLGDEMMRYVITRTGQNCASEEPWAAEDHTRGRTCTNQVGYRYSNIYCIETSRVKLTNKVGGTDFVHANQLTLKSDNSAVLCTQGPFAPDPRFATMIIEKKPTLVVMTNGGEEGTVKCGAYWNKDVEGTVAHGPVTFTTDAVEVIDLPRGQSITITTVTAAGYDTSHTFKHLRFYPWQDFDAPTDIDNFDAYVDKIIALRGVGPIVVHCSAGVGRTGSLITCLDMKLQIQATPTTVFNVYQYIKAQRAFRYNFVQRPVQCQFIVAYLCGIISHTTRGLGRDLTGCESLFITQSTGEYDDESGMNEKALNAMNKTLDKRID